MAASEPADHVGPDARSEGVETTQYTDRDFFGVSSFAAGDAERIAAISEGTEAAGVLDIDVEALAAESIAAAEKEEKRKKEKEEAKIQSVTVTSQAGKNFADENNFSLKGNCVAVRPERAGDLADAIVTVSSINARALAILETLKSESREPTDEEKTFMGNFSGWSGLDGRGRIGAREGLYDFIQSHQFGSYEERREKYGKLSEAVDKALSNGLSRQDDFSTSNEIIDQIYSKLRDFGFAGGAILDPCCGAGRFFGRLPDDMKNSEVVGVEIDPTVSEIASRLYPGAQIINSAVQDVPFSNKFDVVLGNIPSQVEGEDADKESGEITQFLGRKNVSISEKFLAKSVMSARPGGIIALAVGREVMDNPALVSTRETVAKNAEFLGALRLPDNGGGMADRPTDIIFLKKREAAVELNRELHPDQAWVSTETVSANEFSGVKSQDDAHTTLPNGKRILVGGKSDLDFMKKGAADYHKFMQSKAYLNGTLSYEEDKSRDPRGQKKWLVRDNASDSLKLSDTTLGDINREAIEINSYFSENPDMILGDFVLKKHVHGGVSLCVENADGADELTQKITKGMQAISGSYSREWTEQIQTGSVRMGGHPEIKPSSFCIIGGELMFRSSEFEFEALEREENKRYTAVEIEKIKGYVGIRDALQKMIDMEAAGADHEKILDARAELNSRYDEFAAKFGDAKQGAVNSLKGGQGKPNRNLFSDDASWGLVSSIEKFESREVQTKAGIKSEEFFAGKMPIMLQDVIAPAVIADQADSLEEGLKKSLFKKGRVDVEYIAECLGRTAEETEEALTDSELIFRDPALADESSRFSGYVLRDEFLSGNVGEKLRACREAGQGYEKSAAALETIIPPPVPAEQITVTMGAKWLPEKYYKEFFIEESGEEWNYKKPRESQITFGGMAVDGNVWVVSAKSPENAWEKNAKRGARLGKYSTAKMFAGEILENLLNQKTPLVKPKGGSVDAEASQEAQAKAREMEKDFKEWLLRVPERRKEIEKLYHDSLCGVVRREWNGEWIPENLPGMNRTIKLRQHQRVAVERQVLGGNSLIVHGTGAGKTFSMIAGIMEKKRLGIAGKSMLTVPNSLVEQIAGDFMLLYPGAKIKVATDKNFSPANRQKFLEDIRQGDYDCVIIGHSKFKQIPISRDIMRDETLEKLKAIQKDIAAFDKIKGKDALSETDQAVRKILLHARSSTVEQLKKLSSGPEPAGLTFERLGVDNLVVDEAHFFKNLPVRSRSGEGKTGSEAAVDMYYKTRWLNKTTKEKGVTFSTATPVTNHISELWIMQKYTQPTLLAKKGIGAFDDWARQFCERGTNIEIDITGQMKEKTRFVRYVNLPELSDVLSQVADIKLDKTEELKLDLPYVKRHSVEIKMSAAQKSYMEYMIERARRIEEGHVSPREDNCLKITSEGRKLALDERLIKKDVDKRISDLTDIFRDQGDSYKTAQAKAATIVASDFPEGTIPAFGDHADSKVNACADEVWKIYDQTTQAGDKATQLIFLDNSVPSDDPSEFTVYAEMKKKLVERGIPEKEIAFIHDADKAKDKENLFAKVRNGEVRVLLGSTEKLGTGVNVQNKLRALHHLDPTWRASDMEQRDGRGYRPGNEYKELDIFSYATKGTMDGYMYQTLVRKSDMVSRLLTNTGARTQEDAFATEQSVSYRELRAIGSGQEELIEIAKLDQEILVEEIGQKNFEKNKLGIKKRLEQYPAEIAAARAKADPVQELVKLRDAHRFTKDGGKDGLPPFSIALRNEATKHFEPESVKTKAEAYIEAFAAKLSFGDSKKLGEYRGFTMTVSREERSMARDGSGQIEAFGGKVEKVNVIRLSKPGSAPADGQSVEVILGKSDNLGKIDNALEKNLTARLEKATVDLNRLLAAEKKDKDELEKPYEGANRLENLKAQRAKLVAKIEEKAAAASQSQIEEKAAVASQEAKEKEEERSADNSQSVEQGTQQTPSDKNDKKKPQSRDSRGGGLSR